MTLNQQMEEIPKWTTLLIGCIAQAYEGSSKKLPIRTSVKVLSDNLEYLIIWCLSGPVSVRLMEFYCISQ